MDYGKLFSRAWEICWNHKWLFLLGFLAALGASGGGGGNTGFNFSGGDFPAEFTAEDPFGTLPPNVFDNVAEIMAVALPIVIGLTCAAFLIGIVLWLLRLTAQAGMISTVVDVEGGEKVSLGKAFSKGVNFLPRLLGINILLALPIIILVFLGVLAGLVLFGVTAGASFSEQAFEEAIAGIGGITILLACAFMCVAFIYGLVITLLEPVAQRSAVVENMGVIDSLRRGWQVLTQNLGEILILAVLYVVIGFVYGIIVGIILIPIGLIAAGPTIFTLITTGDISAGSIILMVIGFIILGLVGAVLNALWVTVRSVSFTLAYQQLSEKTLKA